MLRKLLLTAALLSSTYGADVALITAGAFPPNNLTTVIVHTDQLDLHKVDHKTTSALQFSGNVYFQPLEYKELNYSFNDLNREYEYPIENQYTRSIRLWFEGRPGTLYLYVNPIAHGLDNNNYYLMNLTLEISKALSDFEFAPETKSEFILSFTKDGLFNGLFNCIDPGQPTQSNNTITFTVVQKPLDESTESEGTTPVRSDLSVSNYTMILDIQRLTSHKGDSALRVDRTQTQEQ